MQKSLHEHETFTGADYSEQKLFGREIVGCTFINCDFSKSDLGGSDFIDCTFRACNLSLAVLRNTGLKDVRFEDCKMLGLDFGQCSAFLFAVSFRSCALDYGSFYQRKLRKTRFIDCSLKETDFAEADLGGAIFQNCDLHLAAFMQTILEGTDFRTAHNVTLDPELNRMKRAKFSAAGLAGLLEKYHLDIHW